MRKVDYSPRDDRPWFRECVHRDCPADCCLSPMLLEDMIRLHLKVLVKHQVEPYRQE